MEKPMKIIIAGGGFIARTHLSAIRSLGHEVTWIVGRNAVRTQAFAEENKIPDWTIDIDEALSSDAEIVHICTPPAEHAGIIRKCLAAGKHIICEKPLCMDPDEAAALAEEAEAAYQERGIITAGEDKIAWTKRNLSEEVKINIVLRKEKLQFCKGPDSVLIDDRAKTIRDWKEAGGIGILHTSPKDTLDQLRALDLL